MHAGVISSRLIFEEWIRPCARFNAVLAAIGGCGPVAVLPEKTRIAFQVRMSFAQVSPRQRWLEGHLVLARRVPRARFRRIDGISRRNHAHHFRQVTAGQIDSEFRDWLRKAYAVGSQEPLRTNGNAKPAT